MAMAARIEKVAESSLNLPTLTLYAPTVGIENQVNTVVLKI